MGLFGKKQSPEELFKNAKDKYEKGRYAVAALTYLKLKGEYLHEGEYQAALCYLAEHDRKNRTNKPKLAITYLTLAAGGGHREAALLLAERFGIRNYLPPETASAQPQQTEKKAESAPMETAVSGPELKFKARAKSP